MPLEFRCQHCGKHLTVAARLEGKSGNCPYCGEKVRYPHVQRQSQRVVVSVSDMTRKVEAAGAISRMSHTRAIRLAREQADRARHRKVLLLVALAVVLLVVLGGTIVSWQLGRRKAFAHSRGGLVALYELGNRLEREGDDVAAYQALRSAAERGRGYTSENPDDDEIKHLTQESRTRAEQLRRQGLGSRGTGNGTGGLSSGSGSGAGGSGEDPMALAEQLVSRDPTRFYLNLPASVPDVIYQVAGLGVTPVTPPEKLFEHWGEPEQRIPRTDATGLQEGFERWIYEARGFEVLVNPSTEYRPGFVSQVVLTPSFTGTVGGLRLANCTREGWQLRIGPPADGSTSSLFRYERPFTGLVAFDEDGKVEKVTVSFQQRL